MPKRRSTVYVDAQGLTRATLVTTGSGAAPIQTALLAHSAADWAQYWEGDFFVHPIPAPLNAPYSSVHDSVNLLFATTTSALLTIVLLAPLSNIFYADGETVDPTKITDIIAAVVGLAVSSSGAVATSFVAGKRSRT